jgi:hypothetical protein
VTQLVDKPAPATEVTFEQLMIQGDMARLSPVQRTDYYQRVCDSLGLNPLTRPFEYITLNGKLVLYARKDATDQLRTLQGVSIVRLERERLDDLYVVTAHATNAKGRSDSSVGAVNVKGLSGEGLANALMRAETKAKRRVTLSLCGLGWSDESEVDSIPSAQRIVVDHTTGEVIDESHVTQALPKPKMVTSVEHRLYKRYCQLVAEAAQLGIDVDGLELPITEERLTELGRELVEKMAAVRAEHQDEVEAF